MPAGAGPGGGRGEGGEKAGRGGGGGPPYPTRPGGHRWGFSAAGRPESEPEQIEDISPG